MTQLTLLNVPFLFEAYTSHGFCNRTSSYFPIVLVTASWSHCPSFLSSSVLECLVVLNPPLLMLEASPDSVRSHYMWTHISICLPYIFIWILGRDLKPSMSLVEFISFHSPHPLLPKFSRSSEFLTSVNGTAMNLFANPTTQMSFLTPFFPSLPQLDHD